jgi:hypothetical protein
MWHIQREPNIPRSFTPQNMRGMAKYLATGDDVPQVASGDPSGDDENENSEAQFTQDQQNADAVPPFVAAWQNGPIDESGNPVNAEDYSSQPGASAYATSDEPDLKIGYRYENVPVLVDNASHTGSKMLDVPTPVLLRNGQIVAPSADNLQMFDRAPDNPLEDVNYGLPKPFDKRVVGQDTTLQGSLETKRQLAATAPVRSPAKWWEKGLAGTVGGLAGWSNAASRMKQPINAGPAEENILYPGYATKLAEFQSRMAPAEQQVEILGQQVGAQYASLKAQSEAQLKQDQAQAALMHGFYWQHRAEMEQNQWAIIPRTGQLVNKISGQVAQTPQSTQERVATALSILKAAGDPDAVAKSAYFGLNGKLPEVSRSEMSETELRLKAANGDAGANAAIRRLDDERARVALASRPPRDPLIDQFTAQRIGLERQNQLNQALKNKTDEESAAQQKMLADIAATNSNPNMTDQGVRDAQTSNILNATQTRLQTAQDGYAQKWRASGLQTDDYDVKVLPVAPTPGPNGTSKPNPPVVKYSLRVPPAVSAAMKVGVPRTVMFPTGPKTVVKNPDGTIQEKK